MTQLNLTPEEDALVVSALRSKAAQYLGMFGSAEPAIEALLAKVEGQLPAAPVVESAPAATEVVEPEVVVEATEESPTEE
jgi:hypothetical protein